MKIKHVDARYDFYWSPEGRKVDSIMASTFSKAKAEFKRKYRTSYGRYMGEVYVRGPFSEGTK